MNKFYQKDFDYKSVYETFNNIINRLEDKKVNFSIEKVSQFNTPTFASEIIPVLKDLYLNNSLLEDAISEELNLKSFSSHTILDLENSIIEDNYAIIDNLIFYINPLSVESSEVKDSLKSYSKNEVLFSDFGFIFEDQLKDLKNKKNTIEKDKKFDLNELSFEKIFQDLIKNSILKNADKFKIYLNQNEVKVQFFVNGLYLKDKEYTILTINNFKRFIDLIKNKYEDKKYINWKYNTTYYKINCDFTEENNIYFEVYNLNKTVNDINNLYLNDKDFNLFIKSLESPSGVIIISGNIDSGKRSLMYSTLKYLNEYRNGDNFISFENKIKNNLNYITQIESNYVEKDLGNFSVVAIDNNESNKSIENCFNLAAKGRLVIMVVESSSIINTLNIINDGISNKELIIENLLSILHIGLFNKLCDSCSYHIPYNKTKKFHSFISLENSPGISDLIKEENVNGCVDCNYGFNGRLQLCELLDNDIILKDLFLKEFNINNFKTEKRSKSWNSIYESSMLLLKENKISLNSIIKSIGYYKK